jgi:hypothetical protein
MNKNYKVNKSYINFLHVRDFFPEGEVANTLPWLVGLKYQPVANGVEVPNFNLVFPDMEMIVGGMLGDWVKIDHESSGTFRIPYHNQIMFEEFDSMNEWRMAVAMEDNLFAMYNHNSGAKDARYGYEFDYSNPEDWTVESTINLKQNDCVFYRPWVFHSFEGKIIYHHKIYVEET